MTSDKRSFFVKCLMLALSTLLAAPSFILAAGHTGAPSTGTGKDGTSYVSVSTMLNEFRSIAIPLEGVTDPDTRFPTYFPESAQTYGLALSYGTFINDYFKVEVRAGTGVIDDTVREVLDVNLAYWFNWYIGFQHPITDYMDGYFMYGVTVYEADETRREARQNFATGDFNQTEDNVVRPSDDLREGLFETSFSQSYMMGLEFSLFDHWYLGVEYGQLISDTEDNINVRQAGTHLRYVF